MPKPYEDLKAKEKVEALLLTAEFVKLKPELLGDASSFGELLDRLEEYAKELHERYPDAPSTVMIGRHTGI